MGSKIRGRYRLSVQKNPRYKRKQKECKRIGWEFGYAKRLVGGI